MNHNAAKTINQLAKERLTPTIFKALSETSISDGPVSEGEPISIEDLAEKWLTDDVNRQFPDLEVKVKESFFFIETEKVRLGCATNGITVTLFFILVTMALIQLIP